MMLFDNLEAHGLGVDVLQILIVGGVVLVLLGLYWRFFVIGAGIIFCFYVFAGTPDMHKPNDFANNKLKQIEEANKKDFMQDCVHYGDSVAKCQSIWNERTAEESKL